MTRGGWGVVAGLLTMVAVALVYNAPKATVSTKDFRGAPLPDDATRIRELQQRGARVFIDEYGRVVRVLWNHAAIVDEDLKLLHGLGELHSVSCRAADQHGPGITDAGLEYLIAIPNLRWLDLSHNSGITNAGMKSLAQLSQLESLDLLWAGITNESLVELQSLKRLRHLTLPFVSWKLVNGRRVTTETGCTAEGLAVLWGLPLEELDGIDVRGSDVRFLQGFQHLHRWRGMSPYFKDTDLESIPRLVELSYLSISLTEGWADTSRLRLLVQFPQIHSVAISSVSRDQPVDETGLLALARLPALTTLRLVNTTDDGLLKLPPLSKIESLDLSRSRIGGAGLAALTRFPKLTTVTLDRKTLSDDGLQQFPLLPNLQELRLDGSEIRISVNESFTDTNEDAVSLSDATLERVLSQVPQLRRLSLAGLPVSNNSLKCLRLAPNLQTLDLSRTQITDDGLTHLRLVPGLQELTLRKVPITDKLFTVLPALPQLRALHQSETAISYQGAESFYRQHPNCYIEDSWDPDWGSFGTYPK